MARADETWVTTTDGLRLAVRQRGSGPTVICVHGYPDDGTMWDAVADRLAGTHRVVAYDVRGAGRSDRPRRTQDYRLDQLADDLAAVADAVSPDRPVHLLGHDWGSIQSWHAVTGQRMRGRIASFTSISGPSLDHAGQWFRGALRSGPKGLAARLSQFAHSWYILYFQLPVLAEFGWRSGLVRRVMARTDPAEPAPDTGDAIAGLNLYRANISGRFTAPRRPYTDIPVQVLAPADDGYVGTPMQIEVGDWAQDLRVRRIPGGHWVTRSRPATIARAAAELIDHVEGGAEHRSLRRARPDAGRFDGRLAVVTGAGSGIGRATALALSVAGADLALTDIDPAGLAETAAMARKTGAIVGEYIVDSADGESMERFAARLRDEHGVPDIVVNNAGIGMAGKFLDTKESDWQRVIDVNLWGVIHGCRAFAAQLVERGEGGHIVNVASAAAYLPSQTLPAYATTKSAVLTLSECLRAELAPELIGVSAVCPGIVNTNIAGTTSFVGVDGAEQDRKREWASKAYAKRGFGPEKVAADILRAIERDVALQPSSPEAKAGLVLSRLTPGLLRAAARRGL